MHRTVQRFRPHDFTYCSFPDTSRLVFHFHQPKPEVSACVASRLADFKCSDCGSNKTPEKRPGPLGPGTLCNRYAFRSSPFKQTYSPHVTCTIAPAAGIST